METPDGSTAFRIGTSGDPRGELPRGNAQQAVRGDAVFNAPQQFVSNLGEDVSFTPDPVLQSLRRSYSAPNACSPTSSTTGDRACYLSISWPAASGATPGRENGVTDHAP
ncbi:hypothetical protein FHX42_001565 [Saccharopolyspora lacisalsi]|uniref:Uncharacterized protein n=1 Tax=Halosaccharopolyspora lacisalsi TaxID=1000566 RepID=A0A839DVF5_9PSEU|nr:hypothetical protein [Halosaccharopolyspora lacisalsi]MBA8824236.1 hypothetical protein [Halosaccharopolyspora lacisalsi]